MVKNFVLLSILLLATPPLFADGYDDIAKGLAQFSEKIPNKRVAVFPFVWADGKTDIGSRVVSERLTTRIVRLDKLEVVERALLDKVLGELKLQISGIVSPESAKELGKVLGVDAMVTGTLIDISGMVEVNARIILTETGEVLGAQYARVAKDWAPEAVIEESYFGVFLGPRFVSFMNPEIINSNSSVKYSGMPELNTLGADLRYTKWVSRQMGFAGDIGFYSASTPSTEVTQNGTLNNAAVSGKVLLPDGRFQVTALTATAWFFFRKAGKTIQPYFGVGPSLRFLSFKPSVFDKAVSKTVGGGGFAFGFRVAQPGARFHYHFELMGLGGGPVRYVGTVNGIQQEESVQINGGGMSIGINFL